MPMRTRRVRRLPLPFLLLLLLSPMSLTALVVTSPCCTLMTHVSGEFTDREALHGPEALIDRELVVVEPFDACSPLRVGIPGSHLDPRGRVALVQRGACNFVQKVLQAQRAGAVGVVVMDSAARDTPPYHIIMQKDENASQLTIPGVFVAYEDGERLLERIARQPPWDPTRVTINGLGELPQDRARFRLLKRAIAFIFLVSAVCALSSGLSIVAAHAFNWVGSFWRTRMTRRLPTAIYRPNLQQELLDDAIHSAHVLDRILLEDHDSMELPHEPIRVTNDDAMHAALPAEACAICLDDFQAGETVKILPCQHLYHVECILPWLERRSGLCPLCKVDATAAFDDAPKSIFGFQLPTVEQILRQEHWFHTFFLMLPASLVSCLLVNTAAHLIRNMWL